MGEMTPLVQSSRRRHASAATDTRYARYTATESPHRNRPGGGRLQRTTRRQANSVRRTARDIVASLPYNLCCIANKYLHPACICCWFSCVRETQYGVLERFGKFDRLLAPGPHFVRWPMERIAGRISTRLCQLVSLLDMRVYKLFCTDTHNRKDVECETKSMDHVFMKVHVSIQYQTNMTHLVESHYSLSSPVRIMTAMVLDLIRTNFPLRNLDDIFSDCGVIANELSDSLNDAMNEHGYLIECALIAKIEPNAHVKYAMNEVEASKRMRQAAPFKAQSIRIEKVKQAEAMAERFHLDGVGLANGRKAIAKGMREIVEVANGEVSTKAMMDLLVLTNYYGVISEIEGRDNAQQSSMFLTHQPRVVAQLSETTRESFGCVVAPPPEGNLLEMV